MTVSNLCFQIFFLQYVAVDVGIFEFYYVVNFLLWLWEEFFAIRFNDFLLISINSKKIISIFFIKNYNIKFRSVNNVKKINYLRNVFFLIHENQHVCENFIIFWAHINSIDGFYVQTIQIYVFKCFALWADWVKFIFLQQKLFRVSLPFW